MKIRRKNKNFKILFGISTKGKPLPEYFPVSFNLLLNLASVCHAKNSDILWQYISSYVPKIKKGQNLKYDELVNLSLNYYNERILPFKRYRKPNKTEMIGIKKLIDLLSKAEKNISAEDIQSLVFSVGKELKYDNLKDWFRGLYETVLGQSTGPRMGGFIKLFGVHETISLLKDVLNKKLVSQEKYDLEIYFIFFKVF